MAKNTKPKTETPPEPTPQKEKTMKVYILCKNHRVAEVYQDQKEAAARCGFLQINHSVEADGYPILWNIVEHSLVLKED